MKKIDIMFPEMKYMARLIKLMKKYSDKIDREKRHIKGIQSLPNYVKKTQRYNVARFQAIMLYQDVCNQFYQDDKDFTYSLYQERFDEDFLKATFWDEANSLSLIKNSMLEGYDTNPDSPTFDFNLNYFILESLQAGFNINYIRNLMDFFVPDNKTLNQYKKGVIGLFEEKRNYMCFSDNYDRKEYNNLLSSIQTLFSMKVGPNDYIPLFEPIPMSELEKSDESQTSKDLRVTKEDLEKAGNKFKLFNPEKER